MIRVGSGGGVERFDVYVPKNHRRMERQLVEYMSKSQESLSNVVDALVRGEKIRKTINLPFSAKMIPNKNQEGIKKVTVNLKNRVSNLSYANRSNGSGRDESFMSNNSRNFMSMSAASSGLKLKLPKTSFTKISRGEFSPSRRGMVRPILSSRKGQVLYDADESSPTRFLTKKYLGG